MNTDKTRINTEEFNKLTIIQKNKYSSVKIRDIRVNPWQKNQNENCWQKLLIIEKK